MQLKILVLKGGTYSVAFGVNDFNVVVGYGNISTNAAHAIVWTSTGGMKDLNSSIPTNSPPQVWETHILDWYSLRGLGQPESRTAWWQRD